MSATTPLSRRVHFERSMLIALLGLSWAMGLRHQGSGATIDEPLKPTDSEAVMQIGRYTLRVRSTTGICTASKRTWRWPERVTRHLPALPGPQVVPPHSKSSDKVGSVNILAVDVGSSSIKLRVLDDDDTSLAAIDALRSLRPDMSQVACFDTSFHTDMPSRAATYAVPREWREEWGIRHFGFHGLSHD